MPDIATIDDAQRLADEVAQVRWEDLESVELPSLDDAILEQEFGHFEACSITCYYTFATR